MSTNLITVRHAAPGGSRLFRRHAIKSLPAVESNMTLRGLVLQADLLGAVAAQDRPMARKQGSPRRTVSDVTRPADRAVAHDMPVGALLNRLAAQGSEVVPVTQEGRLVGILTRLDIIRLLLRGAEERAAVQDVSA